MPNMARIVIGLVFCWLLACWSIVPAWSAAKSAEKPPDMTLYEQSIQDGDRLFDQDRWAEAFERYKKAYDAARQAGAAPETCEAINDMAATWMARREIDQFNRYFQAWKTCAVGLADRPTPAVEPGNLLINGGFESGLSHPWGSGHYESSRGKTRFGAWWNSMNAEAFMKIDTHVRHSGRASLRITNFSSPAPHVFTTTSQRISGLKPNTVYRVSLWARAKDLKGGASFTVDPGWGKRLLALPKGDYDWQPLSDTVNIGHNDYIDFRLIMENTGTIWLDDIVIEPAGDGDDPKSRLIEAESLTDRGQFEQALAAYQALESAHPESPGILRHVRHQAGRIHLIFGRYDEALRAFQWLEKNKIPVAQIDLGDFYNQLGDYDRSIQYYRQALDQYKGDQGTYSLILEKSARTLLAMNRPDDALRDISRSLVILRHIGDRHGEASALNTAGEMQAYKKNFKQAVKHFSDAALILDSLDDSRLTALVTLNRAEAVLELKGPQGALPLAGEAMALLERIGDRQGLIRARYIRGRIHRQAGRNAEALEDFRQAAAMIDDLYARLGAVSGETRRAFQEQFAEFYRDYIDLLFELILRQNRMDLGEEAVVAAEQARSRMFTNMITEVRAARAFAETSRDDEFRGLLARETDLRSQNAAMRGQYDRLMALPQASRNPKIVQELEKSLQKSETELEAVLGRILRDYPKYAELKSPKPLKYDDIRSLLASDEAALNYFITERYIGVWAFNREAFSLSVLPVEKEGVKAKIDALCASFPAIVKALNAGASPTSPDGKAESDLKASFSAFDPKAAHDLYRLLIQPAAPILDGKRVTYVVPDDGLHFLPFEAFLVKPLEEAKGDSPGLIGGQWRNAAFWVRGRRLSYLPSLSVLRSLRALGRTATSDQKPVVAFADPIFGRPAEGEAGRTASREATLANLVRSKALPGVGLSRLPETAEEATLAIEALMGSADDLYLQKRATESNVKRIPLKNYRTILFATHGLMAGDFGPGAQPALALSFVGDSENDGLLELGEILGLTINADLVVLSACNTARESASADRGDGFAGLTRGFMFAGADSLVVTFWSVESSTAAKLMGEFYLRLASGDKAGALAMAKSDMIRQGAPLRISPSLQVSTAHPFFWAPFVLVGESRRP